MNQGVRDNSRDARDADMMLNILLERAEGAIEDTRRIASGRPLFSVEAKTDRETSGCSLGSAVHRKGCQGLGGRDFQLTREHCAKRVLPEVILAGQPEGPRFIGRFPRNLCCSL
jgi:hypothetical protein